MVLLLGAVSPGQGWPLQPQTIESQTSSQQVFLNITVLHFAILPAHFELGHILKVFLCLVIQPWNPVPR